mmetsp:Transcript_7704/g.8788  ORF Transcript_7704/g.8788 Transcript_7704/m.8788 type:complete len:228 (+) Transcript_7704:313-996(+)
MGVGNQVKRPNTSRISAPINGPRFEPSINNERDTRSDNEGSIEEMKYQEFDGEESKENISMIKSFTGPAKMHGALVPIIASEAEDSFSSLDAAASLQRPKGVEIFCTKSNVAGKVYSNTEFFDDYVSTIKGNYKAALYELRIIYDADFVYGVQGFYQIDDQTITGAPHFGKDVNTSCRNEAIKLQYGECIVSISGNYQDVVNGLMINTSLGKTYTFGNYKSGGDTSR